MRYPKIREQEDGWSVWIQPRMAGYRMDCCDCGLVHEMVFRVVKWGRGHKVQFAARRHKRATAACRRGRKKSKA